MYTLRGRIQAFAAFLTLVASIQVASAQVCATPPSGLVSWWAGEGNADDRTGLNNGAIQGGVTFAPGMVGQAFSMHAGVDTVKIPASASRDVGAGAGLTIEAWVNPRDLGRRNPLVEWNHGGTNFIEWGVHMWLIQTSDFGLPNPRLFANLAEADGTPHYVLGNTPLLQTGVWHHVAVTYDKASGQARLFLDGALDAEVAVGTIEPETSYDLFLGSRPAGDSAMSHDGLLDEVSIYNRALTSDEIASIVTAGAAGKCFGNPLLAQLISFVKTANVPRNRQALLASLLAANESFILGNTKAGINQLRAFKNKLRAQVAPDAPLLAATLAAMADQVIASVDPSAVLSSSSLLTGAIRELSQQSHGRVRVKAAATPGSICSIQYTTDFLRWFSTGTAAEVKDGIYVIDDHAAGAHPSCIYRVLVSPPQ